MKVLLVEDNKDLSNALSQALVRENFVVECAYDGQSALRYFDSLEPDLVILDLGLPEIDGFGVLNHLRNQKHTTPVLILTARNAVDEKVKALDLGADDYLSKPFEMPELLARLRALSRRVNLVSTSNEIVVGTVVLDSATHEVAVDGVKLSLPKKEYMTLKVLMEGVGQVKTKQILESNLYSWGEEIGSNAIEVHISNLRKKLPEGFIKTIRGVGYLIPKVGS
ncbi:response regulator [Sessilibacter sp. MAH2]